MSVDTDVHHNVSRTAGGTDCGIVGYLPACYPSPEVFRTALTILRDAGVRHLEVGIPGGVGELEGGTIAAALRAVEHDRPDIAGVMSEAIEATAATGLKPIAMAFRSTVYDRFGLEPFITRAVAAGARSVLVPDITDDDYAAIAAVAQRHGCAVIPFIAAGQTALSVPLSPEDPHQPPFVYVQTADMPTGGRFVADDQTAARIRHMKAAQQLPPVALGFGIKTAQNVVDALSMGADYAIVGTAMVDALNGGVASFRRYVTDMVHHHGGVQ